MIKSAKQLRNPISLAKLLDLLSNEAWKRLAKELGVPEGTDRITVLHDPSLIDHKISRTMLVERVLEERGPAVSMLAEALSFLESHGVAARSTSNVATLPGLEKDLGPQQRRILTEWNDAARRRLKRDDRLEKMWQTASDALDELLEHCSEQSSGKWRDRRGSGYFTRMEGEVQYHEDAVTLLHDLVANIQASLPDTLEDEFLERIAEKCSDLVLLCDDLSSGQPSGRVCINDFDGATDAVRRLIEGLRLIADLLETEGGLADLLEIGVFRNLPQLYELWLLCFILHTLEEAGYPVELGQVGDVERRRVWNLKFAQARVPVACIGERAWVFFQFKSENTATMPDISIFNNKSGTGEAIAVFDAKFSEKHGYGASAYRNTIEKYSCLKGRQAVLEYEDRGDLKPQANVFYGVRPQTPGADRLKMELFCAFARTNRALAVIDCSPSFREGLPGALKRILELSEEDILQDQYVTFGRKAETRPDLKADIVAGIITQQRLSGTLIAPIKETIDGIRSDGEPLLLLIASDGHFEDGSIKTLRVNRDIVWTLPLDGDS
ncbi:MAG: hypothetical protein VR70_08190 [Rhodospirillaceae bacterium BRH_c57]|nr:MAG: hypothetical protein VR70_08190 [Rhodospirillaceae bacterium BRH_c57]